ncbi:DUF4870 domain-containing protein [Staphylococcus americanisciuri]|uniref:DUF4870 domain-containing protein n=1 Tax=Staphylococcus americanisciuri TaxID=2973940 RepID=A0ABT2F0R3_9STAP|nr:DUF4870 domain-containing protein [Staphylococcus americanisciuri]MCS4486038.1 DUF4870 domain-containing protein [Staphylococcus americanisciuri]
MEASNTTTESVYPLKPSDDERLMAVLIYVTSFFTTIILPLIIWLVKRDDSRFIDVTGKNYINFILSYTIWSAIGLLLVLVLVGLIILPIISLLVFIFHIVAIVKAYHGEDYLPPLSIRFFS